MNCIYTFLLYGAFSILSLFSIAAETAGPISYSTIGNISLKTKPIIQSFNIIGTNWHEYTNSRAHKFQEPDFSVHLPNAFEQTKLCFLLLNTFCPLPPKQQLFGEETLTALPLIYQEAGNRSLLQQFSIKTIFGQAILTQKLALPSCNYKTMLEQQTIVKELTQNISLKHQIIEKLEHIGQQEPFLFTFFEKPDKILKKEFQRMYFDNDASRVTDTKLYAWYAAKSFFNDTSFLIPRLIFYNLIAEGSMRIGTYINRVLYDIHTTQSTHGKIIFHLTTLASHAVSEAYAYIINKNKKNVEEAIINHMEIKLAAIDQLIDRIHELTSIIEISPILSARFEDLNIFSMTYRSEFKRLLQILKSNTIFGSKSKLFGVASILTAYKFVEECKEAFIPALAMVGELDAYCAAATLFTDAQTRDYNTYCFVDLVNTSMPLIHFEQMWNPLINPVHAVANNIHLGSEDTHNMVITGPNGSGKSIFMKSVALNIILAQTFGIAAAQKAQLSPFDEFHIYLNVQENLELELSTFMAEKKKLDEICTRIKQAPAGHKSFTIVDEGLKGTVEQVGGPHMHQAGMLMSQAPGNICLLATHFHKPMDLEHDTQGSFMNYHVELLEPQTESFIRTFKLVQGKDTWWFNDHDRRERFIAWLTSKTLPAGT